MVDTARLHRVGDGSPRGSAAERWGIVPELLEARAGVLVALGGPKENPSGVDEGGIEVLLGDVDADVEGVLEGRLRGRGATSFGGWVGSATSAASSAFVPPFRRREEMVPGAPRDASWSVIQRDLESTGEILREAAHGLSA